MAFMASFTRYVPPLFRSRFINELALRLSQRLYESELVFTHAGGSYEVAMPQFWSECICVVTRRHSRRSGLWPKVLLQLGLGLSQFALPKQARYQAALDLDTPILYGKGWV